MADPLRIQVFRGDLVENEHLIDAVVLSQKGAVLHEFGDPERMIAPRSAIKPFQQLLLASSKWAEKEPRAEPRLAIACSSHWGGSQHLVAVKEWLRDLKLQERDLVCGPHWPLDENEKNRIICEHRKPEKLHNNCSGKHTGFLALCLDRGYATSGYQRYDHPVQQELRQLFTRITNFDWDKVPHATDGCGIPTIFVPLRVLASMGLVFFVEDLSQFKGGERIRRAMARFPNLLSGEGDIASWVIKETGGKILVKRGADGNFWGISFKTGMTFFLKVRDGSSRAADVAMMEVLRLTGNFDDTWKVSFEKRHLWPLQNWSSSPVGRMHALSAQ